MEIKWKRDISSKVAAKTGATKAQSESALQAVLESIREELAAGNRVVMTGFGTFEVREIKARKVKLIGGASAGKLVTVPKHKRVGFKPGTELSTAAKGRKRANSKK